MKREDFVGRSDGECLDCVIRAFTVVTERPYSEVHAAFKKAGRKDGCRTPHHVTHSVACQFGLTRVRVRMSVAKFLNDAEHIPRLVAVVSGHAFGVVKGVIADYEGVKQRAIVKWYFIKKETFK